MTCAPPTARTRPLVAASHLTGTASRLPLAVRRPLPGYTPRVHKTTTQTSTPSHGLTLTLPLPLADAYAGQNTKIRDTLNNLILKVCFSHTPDSSSQFHQCALAHLPVLVLCAVAPELADVGAPHASLNGPRRFTRIDDAPGSNAVPMLMISLAIPGGSPVLPDRGHGAPSSAHWNSIPAPGSAHTCSPLRLVARRSSSGTSKPRSNPTFALCAHALTRSRARTVLPRRVKFDVRLMQRVPYEGVSRMREPTRDSNPPPIPNPQCHHR